ncbi:ArnT family glycosyltransferase [Calycomorphotria hydatis]|nr:glycosyltransferase family 39 protein [Calycomorphotria hydatis]
MRQYTAALRARDIYLTILPDSKKSDVEKVYSQRVSREPVYEPPVNEFVAAVAYRLVGKELPYLSTYFATAVWCIGAIVLYWIVGLLSSQMNCKAAVVGFYMTSPLGIVISRTFQPEPLMITSFLFALWLVLRYGYPQQWRHTILLGVACGLLLLAKPGFMLFPLCGAFTGVGIAHLGIKRVLVDVHWYSFGLLSLLPSLLWIKVVCPHQQQTSFMPNLLSDVNLWRQWLGYLNMYYGLGTLLFVLAGVVVASSRRYRWMYLGMLLGYFVFVIATNYRSMTHSYYAAVLLPVLSICLLPLVEAIFSKEKNRLWSTCGLLIIALWFTMQAALIREQSQSLSPMLSDKEYREIRVATGAGSSVVGMTNDYARSLKYHSYLDARHWPTSADIQLAVAAKGEHQGYVELLDRFRVEGATHFVVIVTSRVRSEQDILQYLSGKYPVVASSVGRYAIFDLRENLDANE